MQINESVCLHFECDESIRKKSDLSFTGDTFGS